MCIFLVLQAPGHSFTLTFVKHLISLIQNQHLDVSGAEVASFDHVKHSPGCARYDVLTVVQFADVLADSGSPESMALNTHIVTESQDHLGGGGREGERGEEIYM